MRLPEGFRPISDEELSQVSGGGSFPIGGGYTLIHGQLDGGQIVIFRKPNGTAFAMGERGNKNHPSQETTWRLA